MTTIRVPTTQYAYIEFQFDGSPEEALAEQKRLIDLFNNPEVNIGLSDKEWHIEMENYLNGKGTTAEKFELMNDKQKFFIQECKKYFKRKNYESER